MSLMQSWKSRIDAALLENTREVLADFSALPHVDQLLKPLQSYLAGGKRTRALLAVAGFLQVADVSTEDLSDAQVRDLLALTSAIELYQASALIHDDIIDQAVSRRGFPALHRQYAASIPVVEQASAHNADSFGVSVAILAGDLVLSAADMLVARTGCPAVVAAFSHMTAEVAVGQFLDLRADGAQRLDDVSVQGTLDVVLLKAAHYSVAHPVALGALLAGASQQSRDELYAVTRQWGVAFQLRDDQLGVTGDPQLTGKPVGTDVLTGKKTTLLALTVAAAGPKQLQVLRQVVGNASASPADVDRVVDVMVSSGAFAQHEAMIADNYQAGDRALAALSPRNQGWDMLHQLGLMLTRRKV